MKEGTLSHIAKEILPFKNHATATVFFHICANSNGHTSCIGIENLRGRMTTISKDGELRKASRSYVRACIKELKDMGLIQIVRWQKSPVYQINVHMFDIKKDAKKQGDCIEAGEPVEKQQGASIEAFGVLSGGPKQKRSKRVSGGFSLKEHLKAEGLNTALEGFRKYGS